MIENEVFQLFGVVGDVSTTILVVIFWKLEKRITRLEFEAAALPCKH